MRSLCCGNHTIGLRVKTVLVEKRDVRAILPQVAHWRFVDQFGSFLIEHGQFLACLIHRDEDVCIYVYMRADVVELAA